MKPYIDESIQLLKTLIAIPRTSRGEKMATDALQDYMTNCGLHPRREGNNLWVIENDYSDKRPTLLLNAHIDTVKPVESWMRNPYIPQIEDEKLYGIGSNDDGAGLVTLLQVFRIITSQPRDKRSYNLVFLASAEEEVSGMGGISSVLPMLPPVTVAIVGEPTGMQPAIAERGLMVIDGHAHGKSGHAARNEGVNAIYEALDDLLWLRDYRFERVSNLLGETKVSVTVIHSGTQHNVVPDDCHFIIDVRTNELYTNEEVFGFIDKHTKSELKARSFRLNPSSIPASHPLIKRCISMGLTPFGSPTLSDQALMPFPSLKLGPGDSARSHSADEYICLSELESALDTYLRLLDGMDFFEKK
ncbi:MAG: M20 family metallo-hydrolase [Prevotella sp.]